MKIKKLIKNTIYSISFAYYEHIRRRLLNKRLKDKSKIKVAFIGYALGGSSDVFSNLYRKFSQDPRFEPYIVIVPNTHSEKGGMLNILHQAQEYLDNLGLPYISGYDEKTDTIVDVKKTLNPDIVFLCHHYNWFPHEYQIYNFMDKISYVFLYGLSLLENLDYHVNSPMHKWCHKVFYPSHMIIDYAKKHARRPIKNICDTFLGGPKLDNLLFAASVTDVWKIKDKKYKRLIWAPHHFDAPFSNFLDCYDLFLDLAHKYRDKLQIAFRPHPGLKTSLVERGLWTQPQVDEYYKKWETLENGFYSVGDFKDLFLSSDAMVLDSIAFIAEYATTGKPSLFINKPNQQMEFNTFGKAMKEHIYNCDSTNQIEAFIQNIVFDQKDPKKAERIKFIKDNLIPPYNRTAAENIYQYILQDLKLPKIKDNKND